jgi:hypothetical protein
MTTMLEFEQDFETPFVLTANDRCDAECGAQAYFAARKGDHELLFCGHHAKRHKTVLEAKGWKLIGDTACLETLGYTPVGAY